MDNDGLRDFSRTESWKPSRTTHTPWIWKPLLTREDFLASTGVLRQFYGSSLLALCRFSSIWLESCSSRPYWHKTMHAYRTQKVLRKKKYPEEEKWEYLEEGSLRKSRSACVCMTCQHFDYSCDKHCKTLLTCRMQQRLIPHGEHLNSRCPLWTRRIEREIGWSP